MGRRPRIPPALARAPFTLDEARRHGIERWHLESGGWRRVGPGTYVAAKVEVGPQQQLEAASRRMPPGAAFSGFTAAWLHGLDCPPCAPIEITVPLPFRVSSRSGMRVRRRAIEKHDLVTIRGFRATSALRTVRDLCAGLSLTEAVVITDMALHARLFTTSELTTSAAAHEGAQGVPMLRRVLEHVEPASESPMETRLRMLLVMSGLPRPAAQFAIRDRWHRFLGRPDLYYREQRLGLEYDGATHRDSLAEDNRRQNRLLDAGVRLLRFTGADIYQTPDLVVSTVRSALAA